MRVLLLCALAAFLTIVFSSPAASAKATLAPPAHDAKTYPAVDVHPDEKVTVAIDPMDTPERAAFMQVPYHSYGMVPIRVIVTNDSDQPLALKSMKVQFITAEKQELDPANKDDISRVLVNTRRFNPEDKRLPIPIPIKKGKQKESSELDADWDVLPFRAEAVEPHNTQSGFFFFDLANDAHPLAPLVGARIIVTGLKNGAGQDLFYFEIPLEKYLSYQPSK